MKKGDSVSDGICPIYTKSDISLNVLHKSCTGYHTHTGVPSMYVHRTDSKYHFHPVQYEI